MKSRRVFEGEISSISGVTVNVLLNRENQRRSLMQHADRPFLLELKRALIIRTRLSGNDVKHAPYLLEFGLPYVKDHFDSVVPISRDFNKEARWTELNRTCAKMPDVSFVMGFNVASPTVWVFELALNH